MHTIFLSYFILFYFILCIFYFILFYGLTISELWPITRGMEWTFPKRSFSYYHMYKVLKPPLPDPLKTPPFFSQWAKLENFFETRAERKRPLARVDQGNDSKTSKTWKSFGCLTGMETLVSISKNEALPIGLWPVFQRHACPGDRVIRGLKKSGPRTFVIRISDFGFRFSVFRCKVQGSRIKSLWIRF